MKTQFFGALLLGCCQLAHAQTGDAPSGLGRFVLQGGWFQLATYDSSGPVHTELRPSLATLVGVPERFSSEGSGLRIGDSGTPALIFKYLLGPHLSVQFEGGVPADFDIEGYGTVAPPGAAGALLNMDLGDPANNPLASTKQWTPVLMLHWQFRTPPRRLRPFLGVGLAYTWFTHVELSEAADDTINARLGRPLALAAGKPGATRTDAETTPSFDPVAALGAQLQLSPHWGLCLSASYLPLSTTATIRILAQDGTPLATNTVHIDAPAVAFALVANYRF